MAGTGLAGLCEPGPTGACMICTLMWQGPTPCHLHTSPMPHAPQRCRQACAANAQACRTHLTRQGIEQGGFACAARPVSCQQQIAGLHEHVKCLSAPEPDGPMIDSSLHASASQRALASLCRNRLSATFRFLLSLRCMHEGNVDSCLLRMGPQGLWAHLPGLASPDRPFSSMRSPFFLLLSLQVTSRHCRCT